MLVLLAVGFAMSALEARYLHRQVVREEWVAWIPTVASAIGAVATLLALAKSKLPTAAATLLLSIVALSGVVGLYYHTEFKPSAFAPLFGVGRAPAAGASEEREEEHEHEHEEGRSQPEAGGGEGEAEEEEAPALAPLSLTGLAALGLLTIAGRSRRLDP
jgi:hypothetical protein